MAFEDVLWTQGSDNMGGLIGHIYFCPVEDVDETALVALALEADGVTLASDIPLLTNKKFFKIYHTRGTGKFSDQVVGERDGKSFENMVEFKFPGDTAALLAFKRQIVNTPMVVIFRDPQGFYRLMGISILKDPTTGNDKLTLELPAYIEAANNDSGTGADAKGTTFQIKTEALLPPLLYTGTIDVDAGT